jgi:hypothetical protein
MLIFFIVLSLVVAAVLAYAATKPDNFRIERSIDIAAAPDRVHALIDDFDGWRLWSPWEKKDPNQTRTRSGPLRGVSSRYAWDGNKNVGKGSMEVVETTPARVLIKLDFMAPFEAHNMADFTLAPAAGGTNLNWAMYGPSPYISKLMTTFFSMDKMVGKDFEEGLANLKAQAEK